MKNTLEIRAEQLDEVIRQQKISSRNIDVDKYLHFHDVTTQVKDAFLIINFLKFCPRK